MDWVTHICIAYLITFFLGIKEYRSLVVVGAILPDIFKLFIVFGPIVGWHTATNFFLPFHTLLGTLLSALLFSSFFKDIHWKKTYVLILLGVASHFVLDSLLWPFGAKSFIFWPFWIGNIRGYIWPDNYYPTIISAVACLIAFIYIYRKKISTIKTDSDVKKLNSRSE